MKLPASVAECHSVTQSK